MKKRVPDRHLTPHERAIRHIVRSYVATVGLLVSATVVAHWSTNASLVVLGLGMICGIRLAVKASKTLFR